MDNDEYLGVAHTSNTPPVAADTTRAQTGLGAQTSAVFSKVGEAARQVSGQAKDSVADLAAQVGDEAKGFIEQQVESGADLLESIGRSANAAADTLNADAPQLANFMRGAASSVTEFSGAMRGQSPEALFRTTSDYVRENPVLVLSAAAACGFAIARLVQGGAWNGSRRTAQVVTTQTMSKSDAF